MKKIFLIVWMPIAVYFFNLTSFSQKMYATTTWYDDVMHVIGGVAITVMLLTFMRDKSWWKNNVPTYARLIFAICFAVMFGVMWEWYEFLSDFYLGTNHQPSEADTMKDLLCAGIGSFVFFIAHFIVSARKK